MDPLGPAKPPQARDITPSGGQWWNPRAMVIGFASAAVMAAVLWVCIGQTPSCSGTADPQASAEATPVSTGRIVIRSEGSSAPIAPASHPAPQTAHDAAPAIDAGPVSPEAAPTAAVVEPFSKVRKGVALYKDLVKRHGLSAGQVQEIVEAFKGVFDFTEARPGHEYMVRTGPDRQVSSFVYRVSPIEIYELTRNPDGRFSSRKRKVPLKIRSISAGGVITNSLFRAMDEAGLNASVASRFVEIMGSEAGYFQQQRPGDTFKVITEEHLLDNRHYAFGPIACMEYSGEKTGVIRLFRYEESGEKVPYFSAKGFSVDRSYIRIPLTYSRVSSPFDPKRFHPVLKRRVPHMGVDFAAPVGTPIWAALDGTVTFKGRKGANGLLVILNHKNDVRTYYAHLSRFARNLKEGQEVRRGQVIGYVGSTGRSTGPHLHFGLKIRGRLVDPLKHRRLPGRMLPAKHLAEFKRTVARLTRELDSITIKRPDHLPTEVEGGFGIESGADLD